MLKNISQLNKVEKDDVKRPSFAMVIGVQTGSPSTQANTSYTIRFQSGINQYVDVTQIKPNNRRPFDNDNLVIVPARVGDIVGCYWAGDSVSFFIAEGMATQSCAGNTLPSTGTSPIGNLP